MESPTDIEPGGVAAPLPVQPASNLSASRPLSDQLAFERTQMANERTLLAYVRTALALLAVSVTLLKFFTSSGMHMLGYVLLPLGVGTLVLGLMNFHDVKTRVASLMLMEDHLRKVNRR